MAKSISGDKPASSAIVPVTGKSVVSPGVAAAIASRSETSPSRMLPSSSSVSVSTVMDGSRRSSSGSNRSGREYKEPTGPPPSPSATKTTHPPVMKPRVTHSSSLRPVTGKHVAGTRRARHTGRAAVIGRNPTRSGPQSRGPSPPRPHPRLPTLRDKADQQIRPQYSRAATRMQKNLPGLRQPTCGRSDTPVAVTRGAALMRAPQSPPARATAHRSVPARRSWRH